MKTSIFATISNKTLQTIIDSQLSEELTNENKIILNELISEKIKRLKKNENN